jgi:glycosyltransferase involved in cell wall biosynthesis
LKAGGSVAHTAGVINAFAEKAEIEVVSNDILPDVKVPIRLIKPIKLPLFPPGINELLYNVKLTKILQKPKNLSFIYQRYNGFSFCGAYLSNKWQVPFVLEFNSPDVWKIKHWKWKSNLLKELLKKVYNYTFQIPAVNAIENYNLKLASLITVVSKPLKEYLLSKKVSEEKIIVNPNGVDPEKFKPDIRAEHLIEKYRLKHKTVFGFIGTFGQWHGVENIAKAYGELLKNYPEYAEKTRLFLVGDGVKMEEVRQIVNKYGIERNVVFTGLIPQEKAPEYLSVCDILINATVPNPDGSEFFGSPTKLFEYMAMGRAIISSNIGQMKEILKDGETALLVKAGDVKELMLAMKKLADDKALRKHLGKNARKEVVEKYTWDKHVERILEGVERVVRDVEKVGGL